MDETKWIKLNRILLSCPILRVRSEPAVYALGHAVTTPEPHI